MEISLEEAKKNIPIGSYCYNVVDGQKIICQYWQQTAIGAHCNYLNQGSTRYDYHNLIWDQCKECDIN